MIDRRCFLAGAVASGATPLLSPVSARAEPAEWTLKLVRAAERQIGVTTIYDPAYVRLDYPGGDVPRDRGVCTDVVVRAYRDGLGIDLQRLLHEDMKRNFSAYPQNWGLAGPDANIDHRRVPNLRTFFRRSGAELAPWTAAGDFLPGDLVSQLLPGNLAHIVIVSDVMSEDGATPMVVHNIGAGARRENTLFSFEITGRYRFAGDQA
jgi:uncharacterized protein YijF (DUF1287 family)